MNSVASISDDFRVVVLPRRVDAKATRQLLQAAREAIGAGARWLVFDLAQVEFIDSLGVSGIGAITRLVPPGARLALAALSPHAATIARVTHLHELLPIYATVEAARRAAAAHGVRS